jgi:hypothetical protein
MINTLQIIRRGIIMGKKWKLFFAGILFLWSIGIISFACTKSSISQPYYQGLTVAAPYSYHLSGRTDRIKGFVVKIDDTRQLAAPGLVFSQRAGQGEGYVEVNGERFDLPSILGELSAPSEKDEKNVPGKEGWYSFSSGDDIVGKMIVPLPLELLKQGLNEVTYFRNPDYDGFEIIDTRIENVNTTVAQLIGQTYHLLGRVNHRLKFYHVYIQRRKNGRRKIF